MLKRRICSFVLVLMLVFTSAFTVFADNSKGFMVLDESITHFENYDLVNATYLVSGEIKSVEIYRYNDGSSHVNYLTDNLYANIDRTGYLRTNLADVENGQLLVKEDSKTSNAMLKSSSSTRGETWVFEGNHKVDLAFSRVTTSAIIGLGVGVLAGYLAPLIVAALPFTASLSQVGPMALALAGAYVADKLVNVASYYKGKVYYYTYNSDVKKIDADFYLEDVPQEDGSTKDIKISSDSWSWAEEGAD